MSKAAAHLVKAALLDHGVALALCNGPLGAWDEVGRDWAHGLPTGVVQHNTATSSAVGPTGYPSLEWLLNPGYTRPAANLLTARGTPSMEGVKVLGGSPTCAVTFAAGLRAVLHSGKGGPWPLAGAAQDEGHLTLLGVEHDARQVAGGLTDPQIEAGARIGAAIADLNGGALTGIITHTCWCDGCHLGAHGGPLPAPLPTRGRKDDTVGCGWAKRTLGPTPYNAPWWREQARKYLGGGPTPPPPTPGKDDDMPIILVKGKQHRLLSGNEMAGISPEAAANLAAAGVKIVGIPTDDWPSLEATFGPGGS